MNDDCESICCSNSPSPSLHSGRCKPAALCFDGFRLIDDRCEFTYECQSRCCLVRDDQQGKQCSKFRLCMQECTMNMDCETNCCVSNLCQATDMCLQGIKVQSEYCDMNFECVSQYCNNHKCDVPHNHNNFMDFIIQIVACLIVLVAIVWCFISLC